MVTSNYVLITVLQSQVKRHGAGGVPMASTSVGGKLPEEMIKKLEAYTVLNKFLQSFIDHVSFLEIYTNVD